MTEPLERTSAIEPGGYDPGAIERKWQERWEAHGTNTTDIDQGIRPFYALMMFPYPSAEGLHVGNLFAFTGSDIYGRFQRLQGHTVLEPLGYDAFGIHSENFALKVGTHPATLIPRNIDNFRRQLKRAGLMIDWDRELSTTDPRYYKWTQWLFLQLYQRGLAYKKRAAVNWCPNDKTVLANEQVIAGECERCGARVEQRFLEQWFFRITDYAGRLLDNLDRLDWSDSTKQAQRNWIGRSDGAEIVFRVQDLEELTGTATTEIGLSGEYTLQPIDIQVFTTRPDTIFGATYLVLAPEHPLLDRLTTDEQRDAVQDYVARAAKQDIVSRKVSKEKTGVFTGSYAINPATQRPIPVWVADYVLMEYGTGAIMAVPGHDERDFEFANEFDLPIVRVVAGPGPHAAHARLDEAYTDTDGARLVNSGEFSGSSIEDGKREITNWLNVKGHARAIVNYRLHDWCISRQRYWGPPIPIIYCDKCGTVPVPEKDLPVELPVRRGLQARRHGRLAAGARRVVVSREVSVVRRTGAARDRRVRHVPRQRVVLPALSEHRPRRRRVRRRAHGEVASRRVVHRRQRARGAASAVLALHDDGAARRRAAPFRRAVYALPRARHDRARRRQDVEEPRQRRDSRRIRRALGRRHVPHVPDVPRAVRGRRRLPRSEHRRRSPIHRASVGVGRRRGAPPGRRIRSSCASSTRRSRKCRPTFPR